MLNPETSFSPSGPISYTFQPDPAISEVDHITNNLRSLLEKLDNLKIEASSSSQTSPHCDFRRNGGCQAFLQNMVQATNDFQEFIKTDQLVRVPSIEQPNHENNETIIEGDLTVSEIEDLVFYDEDKIEEDYENLFNGLSPISSSQQGDQTFSRDCYYLGEEDQSLNIPEDDENVFLQDHNVDTISMSNSHVDLVEVQKEEKCNQSSDGYDFSTDLSIEFDIQEDNGQNDSSQDDGMILKLLDKEPETKKPKEAQSTFNTVDLGSNGEF